MTQPRQWRWRNAIVTLLIERGTLTRPELHAALIAEPNLKDRAALDRELSDLVRTGELRRPFRGQYQLPPKEPE